MKRMKSVVPEWPTYLLVPMVMILMLGSTPVMAQQARADIAALLKQHDEAMNKHNLQAILALFAPGPRTIVLGTGPGERFQGREEIQEAYTEYFKDFDQGTMTHDCYWKEGGSSGNTAWGAAMCKFTDSQGGRKREYEMNVSAVAERVGGKWLFRMVHFSNLTAKQ